MIEIKAISYEEARLEYFIRQRAAARQRLKYWADRSARENCLMDRTACMLSDAGAEWNYYNDVIGLLGGPKEATTDDQ